MELDRAYVFLAYRRAILEEVISYMTSAHTAAYGNTPKTIISEDVLRAQSEIPQEDIQRFICELEQEVISIKLELQKYAFKRQQENDVNKQPSTQHPGRKDNQPRKNS